MTGPHSKASCWCSTPAVAGATFPNSATFPNRWAAGPGTPPGGAARVAGRGCRGPAAPTGARRALRRAAAGLVASLHRRGVGALEKGGELTGPNPTDRGKAGSKYHILCDANGLPLHVLLSAANTHDSKLFEPLLQNNPTVRGRRGRSGSASVQAGEVARRQGLRLSSLPRLPAPARDQGPHRAARHRGQVQARRVRWVVERTISWLLRFKRLGPRYDRTERTTLPLLILACAVINVRRLIKTEF
jgi:transposase